MILHVSPFPAMDDAADGFRLDAIPYGDVFLHHRSRKRAYLPDLLDRQFCCHRATNIRRLRDDLQVVGIDARGLTAEMVDDHTSRNWPSVALVENDMGLAVVDSAVAELMLVPLPNPARCLIATIFDHISLRVLSSLMARTKPDVLTKDMSRGVACVRGNGGRLSASALTESRGVRRRPISPMCRPSFFEETRLAQSRIVLRDRMAALTTRANLGTWHLIDLLHRSRGCHRAGAVRAAPGFRVPEVYQIPAWLCGFGRLG